MTTLIFIKL